jgi:hypothetical protein
MLIAVVLASGAEQVAAVEACLHCTLCHHQGTANHHHLLLLLLLARLLHLPPRAALRQQQQQHPHCQKAQSACLVDSARSC